MPPLLSRFTGFSTLVPGPWTSVPEEEAREAFKKQIWFDTAGWPYPGQIRGMMEAGIGADRIFYGSDYPFTNAGGVERLHALMEKGVKDNFTDEEVESLCHGNAERLLSAGMVR